jgi:hypothetical protein
MWNRKSIKRERESSMYDIWSLFVTFPCKRNFLCAGQVKSAGTRKRKRRCEVEKIFTVHKVRENHQRTNTSLWSLSHFSILCILRSQCLLYRIFFLKYIMLLKYTCITLAHTRAPHPVCLAKLVIAQSNSSAWPVREVQPRIILFALLRIFLQEQEFHILLDR